MKRTITSLLGCLWLGLGLSLGAGVVTGCGKAGDGAELGGETHWLRACSEPGDCGGGLECWCGVCTAACDTDATCGAIAAGARCTDRTEAAFASDCAAEAPARLCAEADPPLNPEPTSCPSTQIALGDACFQCDPARAEVERRLTLEVQRNGWDLCAVDADCLSREWSTPCDGQCNVAIASSAEVAFDAALPGYVASVCDPATWQPVCGNPRTVNCEVTPYCVDGRCQIGTDSCDVRAVDRCTEDGRCYAVGAHRFDVDRGCFSPEIVVAGCASVDIPCSGGEVIAFDAAGDCHLFSGGCVPADFGRGPEDHPCRAVDDRICEN